MATQVCPECREAFESRHPFQRFCQTTCRSSWRGSRKRHVEALYVRAAPSAYSYRVVTILRRYLKVPDAIASRIARCGGFCGVGSPKLDSVAELLDQAVGARVSRVDAMYLSGHGRPAKAPAAALQWTRLPRAVVQR